MKDRNDPSVTDNVKKSMTPPRKKGVVYPWEKGFKHLQKKIK